MKSMRSASSLQLNKLIQEDIYVRSFKNKEALKISKPKKKNKLKFITRSYRLFLSLLLL